MSRPTMVIYVDGVFDLFHAGHLAFLQKARDIAELSGQKAYLIVGVISDDDAQWKRKPIMSYKERVGMLEQCKLVDEVIRFPPLIITSQFIETHKINTVVHGDDDPQAEFFKIPIQRGMMRYVAYTSGVSTSRIIRRIHERRSFYPVIVSAFAAGVLAATVAARLGRA